MYYFIWNPTAGKGKAGMAIPVIESYMAKRGEKYTIMQTLRKGHATELAKLAAADPAAKAVTAVGGDGTLLETAAGLVDSGVPLAGVPLGNGNDYMRNFMDLRKHKTLEDRAAQCLNALFSNRRRVVDMIMVNGSYALNIGNMGLDADVADLASRIKRWSGGMSYLLALLKCIFTYKPMSAAVTADGERREGRFTLMAVCNGTQYGGGFQIAPQAKLDDGKLTVCLAEKMPRLKALAFAPKVLSGAHMGMKEITFIECDRVDIEFDGKAKMCLDGNIEEWEGPVSFVALPAALEMVVG